MQFGVLFQSVIDTVISILYSAIAAQYSEFFVLLELFQTLFGTGATV